MDGTSVDKLVARLGAGDQDALDDLITLVYRELHRIAEQALRNESTTVHTRPTSLINDLYLELQRQGVLQINSQEHFLCIAAYLMRQLLVAQARHRNRAKRGAAHQHVPIDEAPTPACEQDPDTLIALNTALDRLRDMDPLKAQVVELRYFAGLSLELTAEALQLSPATVKRHWGVARLWLFRQLTGDDAE